MCMCTVVGLLIKPVAFFFYIHVAIAFVIAKAPYYGMDVHGVYLSKGNMVLTNQ